AEPLRAEVGHRDALEIAVVRAYEIPDGEACEIARAALVQLPVRGLPAIVMIDFIDQVPVCQDREARLRGELELQRGPHGGKSDARQPIARPLRLMIRCREPRLIGICLGGLPEKHSAYRAGNPIS